MRWILDPAQIKTIGRKSRCGSPAITLLQQVSHPAGLLAAPPDIHERTDKVAHHMMEKPVCSEIEDQEITTSLDRSMMHSANRRAPLATRRTKG